jgi:hypothetical protein
MPALSESASHRVDQLRPIKRGVTIKTYPGEMRQVFSTLLLNARRPSPQEAPLPSALAKRRTGKTR